MPPTMTILDIQEIFGLNTPMGNERINFFIPIDQNGQIGTGSKQEQVLLVSDSVVSDPEQLYGGDYVVRAKASNWNSGSVKLQALDADGTSWYDLVDASAVAVNFTANGTKNFGAGSNGVVRAVVTGSPAGLYVSVGRMP